MDQDILRLDIPMHNVILCEYFKGVYELTKIYKTLLLV